MSEKVSHSVGGSKLPSSVQSKSMSSAYLQQAVPVVSHAASSFSLELPKPKKAKGEKRNVSKGKKLQAKPIVSAATTPKPKAVLNKKKKTRSSSKQKRSSKGKGKARQATPKGKAPPTQDATKTRRSTCESPYESEDDDSEEMNEFGDAMEELSADGGFDKCNVRVSYQTVQPLSLKKIQRNSLQQIQGFVNDEDECDRDNDLSVTEKKRNMGPPTQQFMVERNVKQAAQLVPGPIVLPGKGHTPMNPLSILPQSPLNHNYFQRIEFKCSFAKLNGAKPVVPFSETIGQ